ncbi:MAG: hypothetical protein WD382_06250 [Halofilum sp. (in: g-proteobacteria)]
MRFTVYDNAGSPVGDFGAYGEATAEARAQSERADKPDAVYSVLDHEHGLTLNQFSHGETLQERVHKNALQGIVVARSADQLRQVVAEYADALGFPNLGRIDYDAAVARTADHPAIAEVFQAAAEKSDQLERR